MPCDSAPNAFYGKSDAGANIVLDGDTVNNGQLCISVRVVAMINAAERPLGLYFFGDDRTCAHQILCQIIFGDAVINACAIQGALPSLPFGGLDMSGIGRHHGIEGSRKFSNQRGVVVRGTGEHFDAFYAPYAVGEGLRRRIREADWVSAAPQALTKCQCVPRERPEYKRGPDVTAGQSDMWQRASGPPVSGEYTDVRTARPPEKYGECVLQIQELATELLE